MPITDEDRQVCTPLDGPSSSEEEPQVPQAMCNAEFRKSVDESQVREWQEEETAYLKHEGWCENRLIILMQEAFRCSNQNLKQEFHSGAISADEYATRAAGLKDSLQRIKKEYRRTLLRTRDRKGDLPSIANKAVTCIASVYPWCSSGFILGFEENVKFGELEDMVGCGGRRCAQLTSTMSQQSTHVALAPSLDKAPMSKVPFSAVYPEQPNAPAPPSGGQAARRHRQHLTAPRVTVPPLQPLCQLFPNGMTVGGSPLLMSPHTATLAGAVSPASGSVLVESSNRSFFVVSPKSLSPNLQASVPPASIAGPVHNDELRLLEKCQLVVQGMAFVSHSLASSIFISSRRATIASTRMQKRLELAKDQVQFSASFPAPCATVVGAPAFPPPPASLMTNISFPNINSMKLDMRAAGSRATTLGRCISHVMPCASLLRAPGGDSFRADPSSNAPGEPSSPAYAQSVAASGEYSVGYPMCFASCHPSQVGCNNMHRDRRSLYSLSLSMPPVSLEEEKYVKQLW
ncbi:hypothetical protein LPMP_280190 [Leishmania panamensis]|uniref:Ch28 protein n=1 Tax=Leishmania panamensis TaxID=5679 RepID=A0A088RUW7_LEIPA|nr:hypothetical protein LPMP_280190 [Leishmania panamensis]AIN99655.1 hypothetical protein LPMP_280190 [Leishmania panamensis]